MVKRALLVGCNYPGTDAELRGCVNDVKSMYNMLQTCYGFEPANMTCLVDNDPSSAQPTGANMKKHLKELVAMSKPGDVLFFHFSGHGTQVRDTDGGEADNKDEALVPTDMNLICDDDLRLIFEPLSPEVKFTMVSDCCHSGSMLDHPEQQISGNKDPNAPPGVSGMDPASLMGMFFRDIPSGVVDDNKNRSLPQNLFMKLLGDKMGSPVMQGGIHRALERSFGADASAKSLKALGMLTKLLDSQSTRGGKNAALFGIISKILKSCMSASATSGGGGGGGAAAAAGGGGAGGEGKRSTGILITGCQAHETSADACPSGDASKAFGALTNALTTTVKAIKAKDPNANPTYMQLVQDVRTVLLRTKFTQNPCLECENADTNKPFIC